MHIRAEHLHLFPSVLNRAIEARRKHASQPSLAEAKTVVEQLRADHEYFMVQLGVAVEAMRGLLKSSEQFIIDEGINKVMNLILQLEDVS